MNASSESIASFLASAGWDAALSHPLSGDASARSYRRLTKGAEHAILMISPSSSEVTRFDQVAGWLLQHHFSAPRIYAVDAARGLMLLEDLGDDLLFTLLEASPPREAALYAAVTDFLLALHRLPAPDFVSVLDADGLAELTAIGRDWAPLRSVQAASDVPEIIAHLATRLTDLASVMCLRDFHAQNMLWLPGRDGTARLGLLDFQDAVAAHPAYDLVSALQDVRREVSADVETRECTRYATLRGLNPDDFAADYALLGAQRALRIHAVFARLCLAAGKAHYVDLMPRNWALLQKNMTHPLLAPLKSAVDAAFLAPDDTMTDRLKAQCGTRPML